MQGTGVRRYLVLVIGTLAGPGSASELLRRSRRQASAFHFVVPASVPDYGWTWTEGQPVADASERLRIGIEFCTALGLTVQGEVADSDDPVEIVRRS